MLLSFLVPLSCCNRPEEHKLNTISFSLKSKPELGIPKLGGIVFTLEPLGLLQQLRRYREAEVDMNDTLTIVKTATARRDP